MAKLRSAALSDIGRIRRDNQDRCLLDEGLQLFGVADGVSGLPRGALAAEAAVTAVHAAFRSLAPGADPDGNAIVHRASRQVAALGHSVEFGPGTTLTFGWFRPARLSLVHVGDSRCYLWRANRLRCLTEDHSLENEARRRRAAGEKVPSFARHLGAALTRCLGQRPEPVPDLSEHPLSRNDRYLFCTDGITRSIPDPELGGLLGGDGSPAAILAHLVQLALVRGGWDNASGVLVFVDEA